MENEIFTKKDKLFKEANQFWMYGLWINFGVFTLFLVTVFFNWPPLVWFLGLLSLLAPIALCICNLISGFKFKLADKCRRLLHYSDGLGMPVSETEIACIIGEGSNSRSTPSVYISPYYFTKIEPGVIRLLRNTRECAYFTFNLCRHSKIVSLFIIIIMAILAFVILYLVITSANSLPYIQNLAKSSVAIISFLFTANIIVICIKYWQTEVSTKNIYKSINNVLKKPNIPLQEAMILVDDYNVMVSRGPLIFYKIYKKYNDQLNEVYRKAHGVEEK